MTRLLKRLRPPFMDPLDRMLLLHAPMLWKSRLHEVIVLSVLANLAVFLFARLVPIQVHLVGRLYDASLVLGAGSVLAFLTWLGAQASYSIERLYGHTTAGVAFWKFIGYAAAGAMIMASPAVFTGTVSARLSATVDRELLVREFRALNPTGSTTAADRTPHVPTVRKYTGAVAYTSMWEQFGTYTAAKRNLLRVADLIGHPDAVIDREQDLLLSFTLFPLLVVYGACLGMLAFVADYVGPEKLMEGIGMIVLPLVFLFIPMVSFVFPKVIPQVGTAVTAAVSAGVAAAAVVALFVAAWTFTYRATSAPAMAPPTVAALCLTVCALPQVGVVGAIYAGWIDRSAGPLCAVLMLVPVLLFIPLAHRWLLTVISLPAR